MDFPFLDELFDNTDEIRERRQKLMDDCKNKVPSKDNCQIYILAYNSCINKYNNELLYVVKDKPMYNTPNICSLQKNMLYECCKTLSQEEKK